MFTSFSGELIFLLRPKGRKLWTRTTQLKSPPFPLNLFGGVAGPRVYRGSKFVGGGGGPTLKTVQH